MYLSTWLFNDPVPQETTDVWHIEMRYRKSVTMLNKRWIFQYGLFCLMPFLNWLIKTEKQYLKNSIQNLVCKEQNQAWFCFCSSFTLRIYIFLQKNLLRDVWENMLADFFFCFDFLKGKWISLFLSVGNGASLEKVWGLVIRYVKNTALSISDTRCWIIIVFYWFT